MSDHRTEDTTLRHEREVATHAGVTVSLLRDDPWTGPPQTTEVVAAATVGPKKIRLALGVAQARQLSALLTIAGADRALAMAVLDAADLADAP
ncbi:hypothetical protein [Nocardiopsis sp. FIRDI 009]|uniref:hypothetical protein n=1 Tax=Nocardiopsis sp. FIRDI 009 TaxID=714197 RepID=UPI0013003710|nr:hypothetical protein [Nocardiopsis sp. FIRDI 009]